MAMARSPSSRDVARPQVGKEWRTMNLEAQLDEAVKRIEALEEKEARRAAAEAEAPAVGDEQGGAVVQCKQGAIGLTPPHL